MEGLEKVKILITGGTGFIGSWLVRSLVNDRQEGKNIKIRVLVKKGDPIGLGNLGDVQNDLEITYGDVRNAQDVEAAADEAELIFHLAAVTQVLYSIKNPRETFDVNASGTLNVLEAVRNAKNDPFLVLASTDKVYGEPASLPITEDHPLRSKSPYDASKIAADRLAYSYYATYGTGVSIVRCSNIYGGADSNILRAVPDFAYSIINAKPPVIRGTGAQTRDFLHVSDAVRAYKAVGNNRKAAAGMAFNFGTEKETTIREVADMMMRLSGSADRVVMLNKPHRGEIERQVLSYAIAKRHLGWTPAVKLEDGLAETMSWYRENGWWAAVIDKVSDFYGIKPRTSVFS